MRIARLESRLALPAALLVVVLSLALAAPASADIGETIIHRCAFGGSLSGFSQSAYRQALNELSAGTEEYSDCSELIHQAQLAAAAGGRGGSSGGGTGGGVGNGAGASRALAASPSEQRAVTHAAQGGSEPVRLDGQTVAPGVVNTDISSAFSSLPTPLLATLAFLLVCVLALAGGVLRNRVRAHRAG